MAEFLGAGAVAAVFAVPLFLAIALLGLAVPYLAIRLRDEPPPDPQLGAKILFQFGFSAGILLTLAGATTLAVEWMMSDRSPRATRDNPFGRVTIDYLLSEGFSVAERAGLGVILGGLTAIAAAAVCLQGTTPVHRQRVRRTFLGWRLAVHGLVVMFLFTAMLVLALQRGAFDKPLVLALRAVLAAFFVWTSSAVVHLLLFFNAIQRVVRDGAETTTAEAAKEPSPVVPANLEVVAERTSWEIVDGREPPSVGDFHFGKSAPTLSETWPPLQSDEALTLTPDMLADPDEELFSSSGSGAASPAVAESPLATTTDETSPSAN